MHGQGLGYRLSGRRLTEGTSYPMLGHAPRGPVDITLAARLLIGHLRADIRVGTTSGEGPLGPSMGLTQL